LCIDQDAFAIGAFGAEVSMLFSFLLIVHMAVVLTAHP
jgi:hypothetical protein